MKSIYLTIIALITAFAFPAMAEAPNRTTMGFREFVEASGCIIVDRGGYSNLALASDPTDPCPFAVVTAFNGVGSLRKAGPDGVLNTPDDVFGPEKDN